MREPSASPPIFLSAPPTLSGLRVNWTALASARYSRCRDTAAMISRPKNAPTRPSTNTFGNAVEVAGIADRLGNLSVVIETIFRSDGRTRPSCILDHLAPVRLEHRCAKTGVYEVACRL